MRLGGQQHQWDCNTISAGSSTVNSGGPGRLVTMPRMATSLAVALLAMTWLLPGSLI